MFGQMWYVRGKFRLPPDACGPDNGVVQPAPSTAASNNSSISSGLRAALFRWPSSSSSSANTASSLPRKHIVFMGDSLVTGVGCSAEASAEHGHVLPRRVAEVIAQQLQVEVSWRLIGETGADVRTLRSTLLPSLEREVERAGTEGQAVDAVVVMTGLNDIKACFLWATPSMNPWNCGQMMSSLLSSICNVAGARCSLVVAGCPIDAVPRFNQFWPLSSAVRAVTWLWEDQKRSATEAAATREAEAHGKKHPSGDGGGGSSIRFLAPPPSMVRRLLDGADYFASDGMHPNDKGYAVWADLIAQSLLADWIKEEQRGRAAA